MMPPDALSPVAMFELILLLMALVVPLEIVARRLRLPPAAALILAGMALAALPVRYEVQIDPDLMLVLFLPPLLMSSAFLTVWRDFRANLNWIAAMAVGAVVFTTASVGMVAHWMVPGLPWAACFALGAIVSPPDALAAKAVLQRVVLPQRMLVLLEGESLVNDASGLVLFRLAIAAALTGGFSVGHAIGSFAILSVGGIAVGLVTGYLADRLLARLREVPLMVIGSLLTAWASYIAADRLGASGVLSTVTCGLVLGWKQHETVSATGRVTANAVWQTVVFVLESLVFVLIGISLRSVVQGQSGSILPMLPPMMAVIASVVLSRFVWLFATAYARPLLLWRWHGATPIAVPIVMGWAGMRGVVSLAVALSLPTELPGREFILLTTFAVILVTVLVQGSTLGPLIRLMKLPSHAGQTAAMGELDARLRLAEVQLETIRTLAHDSDGALQHPRLLEQFEFRLGVMRRVQQSAGTLAGGRIQHFDMLIEAVSAARKELLRLHREGSIHDSVLRVLESELDGEELAALRRRGEAP